MVVPHLDNLDTFWVFALFAETLGETFRPARFKNLDFGVGILVGFVSEKIMARSLTTVEHKGFGWNTSSPVPLALSLF